MIPFTLFAVARANQICKIIIKFVIECYNLVVCSWVRTPLSTLETNEKLVFDFWWRIKAENGKKFGADRDVCS